MSSPNRSHMYLDVPVFPYSHTVSYAAGEYSKTFCGFPSVPECLSRFDMLLSEDSARIMTKTDTFTYIDSEEELLQCKEAGQDSVTDSTAGHRALCVGASGQMDAEDRCLEQVQSLVLDEVLKDIETACKLLNITPGERGSAKIQLKANRMQLF